MQIFSRFHLLQQIDSSQQRIYFLSRPKSIASIENTSRSVQSLIVFVLI